MVNRLSDDGRVRKVRSGEPGLLISKVSSLQPFDGYTDKEATENKLVRDAFKKGDVWFNTGDLMRSVRACRFRVSPGPRVLGERTGRRSPVAPVRADTSLGDCPGRPPPMPHGAWRPQRTRP